MPAQTLDNDTIYYAESDTAPALEKCLKDGSGNAIDLTGATVAINIAYARWSHYYSPYKRIVDRSPCVVDPDQTEEGNRGYIKWLPYEGALTPTGDFHVTFEITYQSGGVQTVPPNTYVAMVIRATVGGTRLVNVP